MSRADEIKEQIRELKNELENIEGKPKSGTLRGDPVASIDSW